MPYALESDRRECWRRREERRKGKRIRKAAPKLAWKDDAELDRIAAEWLCRMDGEIGKRYGRL